MVQKAVPKYGAVPIVLCTNFKFNWAATLAKWQRLLIG